MGTKNNPGKFDCYFNADPDEPRFVLLGRDKHAPLMVQIWAALREIEGESVGKVAEARACSISMSTWRSSLGRDGLPPGFSEAAIALIKDQYRAHLSDSKARGQTEPVPSSSVSPVGEEGKED